MSKRKSRTIDGQFIAHNREMRESVAWQYMPDEAFRVLLRLELEHMHQGGAENGNLIVTHQQFIDAGVARNAVAPLIRVLAALGFVEVTRKGLT